MNSIDIVKAYYSALDSDDMQRAGQFLSPAFQMVDFTPQPLDYQSMLGLLTLFKQAFPNLKHSLSNIRMDGRLVKLTVQLSGAHDGTLDLRTMGMGVFPRTRRFMIFPNENIEITLLEEKITREQNVSAASPFRRLPGMVRALGIA